jgi:hypothetical protein
METGLEEENAHRVDDLPCEKDVHEPAELEARPHHEIGDVLEGPGEDLARVRALEAPAQLVDITRIRVIVS